MGTSVLSFFLLATSHVETAGDVVRQILYALLVLGGLWGAVWANGRLFGRKILPWLDGLKTRESGVLAPEKQTRIVRKLLRAVQGVIDLAMGLVALLLLFDIFPFTRSWVNTLLGWVWRPLEDILVRVWHFVPDLLVIVVALVVTKFVVRWLRLLSLAVQSGKLTVPGFYADWAHTTYVLVRTLLYIITFVFIFPYLPGAENKVFQGVSVLVGVVVSLGSTSVVSNLMSGLVITYTRPFLKGDYVKIGTVRGAVVEKTPFVTRIQTYQKEWVTIPNAQVLSGNVVNYTTAARAEGGVALATTITIGYQVPWRTVHELMVAAAGRTTGIVAMPEPYVLQTSLDGSYVSYELCAYTLTPEHQSTIYSELHKNLQDVFAEAKIEILSPEYRAERMGNGSTVPAVSDDKNTA